MNFIYQLREEDKALLREKFGTIYSDEDDDFAEKIKKEINGNNLYSVGDYSTNSLIKAGIEPEVFIFDGKVERFEEDFDLKDVETKHTYLIKNPQGTITERASTVVTEALENDSVKIKVDGEEDLLAVCIILYAEKGSFLAYGLPAEGLMLIEITKELKKRFRKTLQIDNNCR